MSFRDLFNIGRSEPTKGSAPAGPPQQSQVVPAPSPATSIGVLPTKDKEASSNNKTVDTKKKPLPRHTRNPQDGSAAAARLDYIPANVSFSRDDCGDSCGSCSSMGSDDSSCSGPQQQRVSSIRESWQRKSYFAKLSHEMQQYQKMVADLERLLNDKASTGETPEAAWKARILVQSAQETDVALQAKLEDYERTLNNNNEKIQHSKPAAGALERTASACTTATQMGCHKLRRDFQRSRKALATCVHTYAKRQQAEISQLGAVRHAHGDGGEEEADFFDRAVRQKELERINQKMHVVNGIYRDLAGLVDQQQEPIDELEEEIGLAKDNVAAGADEIHCLYGRRGGQSVYLCGAVEMNNNFYNAPCGVTDDGNNNNNSNRSSVDRTVSFSDDKPFGIRVTEDFRWTMPLETIKEDIHAVRNDLVEVGKAIKQRFQCGGGTTLDSNSVL